MKIKRIVLKDFKRFSDLTIENIPEDARLILLVGPNGSGKSSLFDAMNLWSNVNSSALADYHLKLNDENKGILLSPQRILNENILIELYDEEVRRNSGNEKFNKAFYIRTAYRYESDFSSSAIGRIGDPIKNDPRPMLIINEDKRVSNNYNRIASTVLKEVFDQNNQEKSVRDVVQRLINKVRIHFQNIFPDLTLIGIGNPAIEGTFTFMKGESSEWKYKNLSAGEKAVFDIILDLCIKSEYFDDTVYCIDEPEIHMQVDSQRKLLIEILNLLPEKCQIFLATHSVGMVSEAFKIARTQKNVYIIDFDKNFDEKVILNAIIPNREILSTVYSTTLSDLASMLAPELVIICEGNPSLDKQIKNKSFDAKCLNNIFSQEFSNSLFISVWSSTDVTRDSPSIKIVLDQIITGTEIKSLIDRDERNEIEIIELRGLGISVLSRRDLENYLWDDEVIINFLAIVNKQVCWEAYTSSKTDILLRAAGRGLPSDDIKSMSSELFSQLKKILNINALGQDKVGFSIQYLSKCFLPEMQVYKDLKFDIFGG